jgi:hypothetical protein
MVVVGRKEYADLVKQFGHNDVKAVPVPDFQKNLENMAKEIKASGGTPVCSSFA